MCLIKATCRCPVGLSGVCCHILALLLYLKHYTDTEEKILELTCTQQLQKWHRRSKKGSIPMASLNEIKPKLINPGFSVVDLRELEYQANH